MKVTSTGHIFGVLLVFTSVFTLAHEELADAIEEAEAPVGWEHVTSYGFDGEKLLLINERLQKKCRYSMEFQSQTKFTRHCREGEFDDVYMANIIARKYCDSLVFSDFYPEALVPILIGPETLMDDDYHHDAYLLGHGITFTCSYPISGPSY